MRKEPENNLLIDNLEIAKAYAEKSNKTHTATWIGHAITELKALYEERDTVKKDGFWPPSQIVAMERGRILYCLEGLAVKHERHRDWWYDKETVERFIGPAAEYTQPITAEKMIELPMDDETTDDMNRRTKADPTWEDS